MIITYQGENSFRISQGDLALALNPQSGSRAKNDLTLYTSGSHEFKPDTFTITGPGEYEVKNIVVKGLASKTASGSLNTIYYIVFEGMNLCFLGDIGGDPLPEDTLESIEDVDILFVPVGAYKLAVSLEPKIMIPMAFDSNSLKQFLKEGGVTASDAVEKLVVKKKDLDGKKGEIIVLKEE